MPRGQGSLSASDATSLAYQYWIPEEPTKAVVAYLHGVGGHSGQPTYRYFIDYLVDSHRAVYGLDLRGFGRSGGRRGHVDQWRDYVDDVSAFMAVVAREHPDQPLFLFGQSLGGLIALEYVIATAQALSGIIVSAPAVTHRDVPSWVPPTVRALAKVAPTIPVNSKLDPAAFTRDRSEVARLEADPLRYPRVTVRFVVEFDAAVGRVRDNVHRLVVPILILVGSADSVTPPQASQALCDAITIADKTLNVYDGSYHQPILDTNRDQVLSDLGAWISSHSKPTSSSA